MARGNRIRRLSHEQQKLQAQTTRLSEQRIEHPSAPVVQVQAYELDRAFRLLEDIRERLTCLEAMLTPKPSIWRRMWNAIKKVIR